MLTYVVEMTPEFDTAEVNISLRYLNYANKGKTKVIQTTAPFKELN